MGMSQFVEKNLSPPRVTGGRQGALNCSHVEGEGPVGFRAACCWVSVMKALPWSMSIQLPCWDMIMEVGVDVGSMLVPELVWLSSVSMRVVEGLIMFIWVFIWFGGVLCCAGAWWRAYPYQACRAWVAAWFAPGGEAQPVRRAEATWLLACGAW